MVRLDEADLPLAVGYSMLAAQLQYQLMISSSWESSNLNILILFQRLLWLTEAVLPCVGAAAIPSSTCPEPEMKFDTLGRCDAAASELYDGPATITSSTCLTCPDKSLDQAQSQLNGCDQRQDTPQIMEPRSGGSSEIRELRTENEDENVKNEILALEIKLLEEWNCSPQNLLLKKQEEEGIFGL